MKEIKSGSLIKVSYEDRDFDVIVIDPDGLGKGQPSVGFGFRMMERYAGLPTSTSDNWLEGVPYTDEECLKLPSGNTYRVSRIQGEDSNEYVVVEASDWSSLVVDVLKKPGRVKKSTKDKLLDFLGWFATKGFYAEAYTALKGMYTARDSRSVSAWMEARLAGKRKRNKYTDFLQAQGCKGFDYAKWTDYVYLGLFGMKKKQMVEVWLLVEGSRRIGRNYVPEVIGLEAVAYCEDMAVELCVDGLRQAHDDAIDFTKRKFFGGKIFR